MFAGGLSLSHCFMDLLYVFHCVLWFVTVSQCQCHGDACSISLSRIVAGCLSLTLLVPKSCYMSLTVSYGCWLSLTVSPVSWSYYMSLIVFHCCWLSLTVSLSSIELLHVSQFSIVADSISHSLQSHGVAACLLLCPIVAGFLSLSFLIPKSSCMSLTVSYCCWLSHCLSGLMEFLHVSHFHLWFLAASH